MAIPIDSRVALTPFERDKQFIERQYVSMVERIARALCAEHLSGQQLWGEFDATQVDESWTAWIKPARSLLTEMREPTLHMIVACGDLPGSIQHDWPRLIDAALSEPME